MVESGQPAVRSWPGLTNPHASPHVRRPVTSFTTEFQAARRRRKVLRAISRVFYRFWRGLRSFTTNIKEYITEAPKRTRLDFATGLPIALLPIALMAIEPVRLWAESKFMYIWGAFLALVVFRFFYGLYLRGAVVELLKAELQDESEAISRIYECCRTHIRQEREGQPLSENQLRGSVATILQALVDLARQVLRVPDRVTLHSNLMIPMDLLVSEGEEERTEAGLGIVSYNVLPLQPSWSRVLRGDFGAGKVLTTGRVQVIEDTRDPYWCGLLRQVRSHSFASLPLLSSSTGEVLAVVNIDADRPMVFRRRNVNVLYRALGGPLSVFSDFLEAVSPADTQRKEL